MEWRRPWTAAWNAPREWGNSDLCVALAMQGKSNLNSSSAFAVAILDSKDDFFFPSILVWFVGNPQVLLLDRVTSSASSCNGIPNKSYVWRVLVV